MYIKNIQLKTIEYIKENKSWNEFICSLNKEELREYLNSEEFYLMNAKSTIAGEKLWNKIYPLISDGKVHCFIDIEYRGITRIYKDLVLFYNGMIYKTYNAEFEKLKNNKSCYSFYINQYYHGIHNNNINEFKKLADSFIENHPEYICKSYEENISIMEHYKNLKKLF